jgi:hypothetical protein
VAASAQYFFESTKQGKQLTTVLNTLNKIGAK